MTKGYSSLRVELRGYLSEKELAGAHSSWALRTVVPLL
jgi:hypothetical protein